MANCTAGLLWAICFVIVATVVILIFISTEKNQWIATGISAFIAVIIFILGCK